MADKEDFRAEYEDLRKRFRQMEPNDIKSGTWLASLVLWVLEDYSKRVDADYIRRKYPGAGPVNQAKKAVTLAAQYASIAGGMSAAAVTALELSIPATGGLDAIVAVPAIGGSIFADVALTSRIQLRSTYDLSVIHGAPLALDDAEDALFIFAAALGVKVVEAAGDVAKMVGPKIVAYNVRKLLRSGLRSALVAILKKVGGTQLAKKLTERAMTRLLVPVISVPISAGANYLFTRSFLRHSNAHMVRRGAVIQPLMRLHRHAPDVEPDLPIKALIAVMEAPRRQPGWDEQQLQALRCTQSFTCLSDDAIRSLDSWFERTPQELAASTNRLSTDARTALVEYLIVAAALGAPGHDDKYAEAISQLAEGRASASPRIEELRTTLVAA